MISFFARLYSLLWFWRSKNYRRSRRVAFKSYFYGLKIKRKARSVGRRLVVRAPVNVTTATVIGDGCILNGLNVYGKGEVNIGNHVAIGNGTVIHSENHDYDTGRSLPFGSGWIQKPVIIEDCAWIAMNVLILPGTHIGEGAVVQAGAVVHGHIPALAIAGGNPAKVFSWRDRSHYETLKKSGRFAMC